jgi:hypothetical protein
MDNLMRDEPRTGGRGLLKVHSQELMAGVYLRSILRLNTGGGTRNIESIRFVYFVV